MKKQTGLHPIISCFFTFIEGFNLQRLMFTTKQTWLQRSWDTFPVQVCAYVAFRMLVYAVPTSCLGWSDIYTQSSILHLHVFIHVIYYKCEKTTLCAPSQDWSASTRATHSLTQPSLRIVGWTHHSRHSSSPSPSFTVWSRAGEHMVLSGGTSLTPSMRTIYASACASCACSATPLQAGACLPLPCFSTHAGSATMGERCVYVCGLCVWFAGAAGLAVQIAKVWHVSLTKTHFNRHGKTVTKKQSQCIQSEPRFGSRVDSFICKYTESSSWCTVHHPKASHNPGTDNTI